MAIAEPFPAAPQLIAHVLSQLRILRSGNQDAIALLGDISALGRPWIPGRCGDQLRHHLWLWCDDVVAWINRQYAWRPAHLIPECWPRHPHIAQELPLLACQRVLAENDADPDLLEEWQRHTLPLFIDRLVDRLGESGCRTGKHVDWPAASRYDATRSQAAIKARQDMFVADTQPPQLLRPAGSGPTGAAVAHSRVDSTDD